MSGPRPPKGRFDLTGQAFGLLQVVSWEGANKNGERLWLCRCECGNSTIATTSHLKQGHAMSCGCLREKRHDLTGMEFGALKVKGPGGANASGNKLWLCECACGKETLVATSKLKQGLTKSCGCRIHKAKDLAGQRFGRLVARQIVKPEGKGAHWLCDCDCGGSATVPAGSLVRGITRSCGCLLRETQEQAMARSAALRVEGTNLGNLTEKLSKNNTSGHKGVTFDKARRKWVAQITVRRENIRLGRYDDIEDAIAAREEAERIYFDPILSRHGMTRKGRQKEKEAHGHDED